MIGRKWDKHRVDELVVYLGEFIGHVDRHIGGDDCRYGGFDVSQGNREEEGYWRFARRRNDVC